MSNKTKGFTNWTDIAKTVLLGKKIVRVEYIDEKESSPNKPTWKEAKKNEK